MDYMVGLFGRHFFSVVAIKGGIVAHQLNKVLVKPIEKACR